MQKDLQNIYSWKKETVQGFSINENIYQIFISSNNYNNIIRDHFLSFKQICMTLIKKMSMCGHFEESDDKNEIHKR